MAQHSISIGPGISCAHSPVANDGRTILNGCGQSGGGRYLYERDNRALGLDFSYFGSRDKARPIGELYTAHAIAQYFGSDGYARPYFNLGGGLARTGRHGSEHPAELSASGAVGVEFGDEGPILGIEARTVFMLLDSSRFSRSHAIVNGLFLRVGWRFK